MNDRNESFDKIVKIVFLHLIIHSARNNMIISTFRDIFVYLTLINMLDILDFIEETSRGTFYSLFTT